MYVYNGGCECECESSGWYYYCFACGARGQMVNWLDMRSRGLGSAVMCNSSFEFRLPLSTQQWRVACEPNWYDANGFSYNSPHSFQRGDCRRVNSNTWCNKCSLLNLQVYLDYKHAPLPLSGVRHFNYHKFLWILCMDSMRPCPLCVLWCYMLLMISVYLMGSYRSGGGGSSGRYNFLLGFLKSHQSIWISQYGSLRLLVAGSMWPTMLD